ncbi:MAG TPA: GNAT family N-acetyltransferase [Pyrinomonadaceae bacterium]
MSYRITFEQSPAPEELRILSDGIDEFTRSKIGARANVPLTFFLKDEQGAIVGGVHGNYSDSGWLYVSTLWVSEHVRGGGHGSRLLEAIEREAAGRGCANVYLDTFGFQALGFYMKLGYGVFGELEDFPPGHSRFFLRKKLGEAASPGTPADA